MSKVIIENWVYDNPPTWNMTNDLIFKAVFGSDTETSRQLLIYLINTVLSKSEKGRIVEITGLNPYNYSEHMADKESVLDIKCKTDSGLLVNVEIQVTKTQEYLDRALYYWADLYSSQLDKGLNYAELNPTIGIHLIDFELDKGSSAHSVYKLRNSSSDKVLTDHLELHFVQLTDIHAIMDLGEDALAELITVIKGINQSELKNQIELIAEDKEVISMAVNEYLKVTAEERMRWRIKDREHFKMERATYIHQAQQALQKAERALVDGREKGREEGREEGRNDKSREIVITMLLNGIAAKDIASMTGIPLDFVKSVQADSAKKHT